MFHKPHGWLIDGQCRHDMTHGRCWAQAQHRWGLHGGTSRPYGGRPSCLRTHPARPSTHLDVALSWTSRAFACTTTLTLHISRYIVVLHVECYIIERNPSAGRMIAHNVGAMLAAAGTSNLITRPSFRGHTSHLQPCDSEMSWSPLVDVPAAAS